MPNGKPPKQVQVGAIPYAVIVDEAAINKAKADENDLECWARNFPAQQKIVLDPTLGPDFMAETLLHELIHLALHHAGTDDLTSEQLERVCSSAASSLLGVLRANPALVTFLLG